MQVAGYITAKHIVYICTHGQVKSQADHADSLGNSSGNQADIKCSTMQLIWECTVWEPVKEPSQHKM